MRDAFSVKYMLILAHYHIILQTLGTFTNINSTKQNTVTTTLQLYYSHSQSHSS